MPNKDIANINDYFTVDEQNTSPKERWNKIFTGWINRIEEKELTLTLFELKLWIESLEEFLRSDYIDDLTLKYDGVNARNYKFHTHVLSQISSKLINHLKKLDFKKDPLYTNFEEFVLINLMNKQLIKELSHVRDKATPESWFNSTKLFLQNFKTIITEVLKNDTISSKTFNAIKKLYHKEIAGNPIIVSLLDKKFIPKIDKTYQKDISKIISSIKDKTLKKELGIFFILSFRIVKINNFIEANLNRTRNKSIVIPLIVFLKKNIENMIYFYKNKLQQHLLNFASNKKVSKRITSSISEMHLEYKKIFDGEFPYYFSSENDKLNKRKLLKNIIMISDIAIQEFVESIAQIFNPEISGNNIFNNYTSRKQKSIELQSKLTKLHTKINDYFSNKDNITPSDIFFDINLFIETDLNYLLYKDWNEFLKYYNNLVNTNFSTEFEINLRSFHSFITNILKEIVNNKNKTNNKE
jgi:hypothetical protein